MSNITIDKVFEKPVDVSIVKTTSTTASTTQVATESKNPKSPPDDSEQTDSPELALQLCYTLQSYHMSHMI